MTLKASKEGYLDAARTLTVTDDRQVNVEITPIASQVDITGTYTLTLTISPACAAVPEQYRIRTYTANIRQTRTTVSVVLTDAKFKPDVEGSDNDGFGGIAFGTTVSFTVGTPGFDGDQLEEILPEGHILGFSGKMVTEGGRTMAGDFPGEFTFTQDTTVRSCSTTDSRLAFTRR